MNNDQIHVRAEFTIEKGKIEEFKKLVQDMSRMVENSEPDTINISFISIDLKQSVWSMKHTQIQRVYLLTHYWRCIENNIRKDFQYFKIN